MKDGCSSKHCHAVRVSTRKHLSNAHTSTCENKRTLPKTYKPRRERDKATIRRLTSRKWPTLAAGRDVLLSVQQTQAYGRIYTCANKRQKNVVVLLTLELINSANTSTKNNPKSQHNQKPKRTPNTSAHRTAGACLPFERKYPAGAPSGHCTWLAW